MAYLPNYRLQSVMYIVHSTCSIMSSCKRFQPLTIGLTEKISEEIDKTRKNLRKLGEIQCSFRKPYKPLKKPEKTYILKRTLEKIEETGRKLWNRKTGSGWDKLLENQVNLKSPNPPECLGLTIRMYSSQF